MRDAVLCGVVQLLVAHPGHELLLQGWISRSKPVVHVLTDGSGYASASRLDATAQYLRQTGARPGSIFGRLSDREAYAMIRERNAALLLTLVDELAAELSGQQVAMIVHDAAEGYNPVHDLCRMIAGAAISIAGVETKQYEFDVVGAPRLSDAEIIIELDAAEFGAKLARARAQIAILADVDPLLERHGEETYRLEALRRVVDWTADTDDGLPLYEQLGAERVAAGRYDAVIRRDEHMLPLRDALRAEVEKRTCAF